MKVLVLLGLLLHYSSASSCGELSSCYECDSFLDTNGKQACSWCETGNCVPNSGLECLFSHKITDKNECPMKIPDGCTYNETLSKKMLYVSAAAYANNPEVCLRTSAPDVEIIKQINVKCDPANDDCSVILAISKQERAIILTFRGTIGNIQLLMEAEYAVFQNKVDAAGGGTVCKYFSQAFYALWDGGVLDELKKTMALYPTYTLWVTGHSMGAALASVASDVIVATNVFPANRMKLITFGEPRVGDKDYVDAHDRMIPYNYRVTHQRDIVTHIPPKDWFSYHHHRFEVWYDNEMAAGDPYVVCLSPEDKGCSDQHLIQLSAMDHRYYFGIDILDIIDNNCHS